MSEKKRSPKLKKHIKDNYDSSTLATIGIIALIDEATGYQKVRDKNALQDLAESGKKKKEGKLL